MKRVSPHYERDWRYGTILFGSGKFKKIVSITLGFQYLIENDLQMISAEMDHRGAVLSYSLLDSAPFERFGERFEGVRAHNSRE